MSVYAVIFAFSSSTRFIQLTFYKEAALCRHSAVDYQDKWNLRMGSQSSRTRDIHRHGYRIRQMPYASSREVKHPENSGAGVSRKEHDNGVGRRGDIFLPPPQPSLQLSGQDSSTNGCPHPVSKHRLLLSYVYFCYIFVLHLPTPIPSLLPTDPKHLY